MKSRVILTAAELDLFTKLDKDSITARDLAAMLDLNERATTRILNCLITYRLVEKQNDCYWTTETGSYLSSIHPQSILPSVKHANRLWNNWSNLTVAISEGTNTNEAGRLGGLATLRKKGRDYFVDIGHRGQQQLRCRYPDMAATWGRMGGRPRKRRLQDEGEAIDPNKGGLGPA